MNQKQMNKKRVIFFVLTLVALYILWSVVRSFAHSLFFSRPGRITLLYYSDVPKIVSIGRSDGVSYELFFTSDKRILVPGGYGRYRIGALQRLAEIEKKPELLTRAFSSALSAQVDYTMTNHAHIPLLDRLYLYFLLFQQKKSDFITLNTRYVDPSNSADYSENSFQKKYKGFFYDKRLRMEGKNISMVYATYSSAKTLSRIIEGEGIRVVDVSYSPRVEPACYIIEHGARSLTATYLATTFKCGIKEGAVKGADIQFILGSRVERDWE